MRTLAILPIVAVLGLAACDEVSVPGSKTTPIPGNYAVTRVNGAKIPAPGISLTLRPNGTFGGKALCNTYQGKNARPYPSFRPATFSNGKRDCDPNLSRVELDFFRAISRTTSLTQGSGGIILTGVDDDGKRIAIDATRR